MLIIDGIRYKERDARRLGLVNTADEDTTPKHKAVQAPRKGGARGKPKPAAKEGPKDGDGTTESAR